MNLPQNKPDEYLSIDIETTALETHEGQIIEFAAVIDNFCGRVDDKPVFRRLIIPESGIIRGHVAALAMNAEIIAEIAAKLSADLEDWSTDPECCLINELDQAFANWCLAHEVPDKPTVAGKNFAAFDLRFLRAETGFIEWIGPSHRFIDPGSMYWRPEEDGMSLPNTATCLRRAGLPDKVRHRAAEDARDVCRLIRHHFGVPL